MVVRPLYEPNMAPPYPSDSASQQEGQNPEPYVSPLPRIPTNPPGGSPPARPMSSDAPSEGRPAGYPYSPDQLSYPSYVRGHSYQQPAPAPVQSPYLYTGQPSPRYAAPQPYSQQYPQQPTYAEAPASQPAYSPQPPYSPQSPQPPYPSSQPSAFEAPTQPQYASPPAAQPTYSPQPQYSPQPPQSPQPAAFEAPAQPQYADPPAPPPYSSSAFGDDVPGDVKKEYSDVDPMTGASIPSGTDEERGLMGAMLGGATGAYAGHKVNHGFIGALGGAYAGHKLEDAWKDHRNSRPSSSSSQQHQQPMIAPPQPQYAEVPAIAPEPVFAPSPVPSPRPEPPRFGNFSHSSARISLDRDYDLIAECRTLNGQQKLTSISLNQLLSNMNGHFQWAGAEAGNFGASARNVRLVDDGRFLEAELRAMDGNWRQDRVHLDARIMNVDGDLQLV